MMLRNGQKYEHRASAPVWRLREGRVCPPSRLGGLYVWGIVNITPDSFYDGGSHSTPESALEHARLLHGQGADVLDLGGASSRPGAADVSAEEEIRRVLPVLSSLLREREAPPAAGGTRQGFPLISVDTWRAAVARAVLEAGADIINDISAFAWEPDMLEAVAAHRPGYVLMHCQGRPGTMQDAPAYANVTDEVLAFFVERMDALVRAGLPEEHILLDPGIGFGKRLEHNLALLRGMERLFSLGRPVLLGISQKSMFGDLLGLDRTERGEATDIVTALMAARGVAHHRVHDVASAVQALRLTDACRGV